MLLLYAIVAGLLLVFLTYPLGLGVWLGFTDERVGRSGIYIWLENYEFLWNDNVFWLSVFNTFLYTIVASIVKFGLGLWLAFLQSGVHATLAGVLLAMTVPASSYIDTGEFLMRSRGLLDRFERAGERGDHVLSNEERQAVYRRAEGARVRASAA
jgi:ABC-type glycerol-3-phosphate transport system permease component